MAKQFWADPVLDAAYQKMIALQPVKDQIYEPLDTPEAMDAFKIAADKQIGEWRLARMEYRNLLNKAGPFPKRA